MDAGINNVNKRKGSGTQRLRKSYPNKKTKQVVLFGSGMVFTDNTLDEDFK